MVVMWPSGGQYKDLSNNQIDISSDWYANMIIVNMVNTIPAEHQHVNIVILSMLAYWHKHLAQKAVVPEYSLSYV